MLDLTVPGVVELLRALGARYVWGAGSLAEIEEASGLWPCGFASGVGARTIGYDCSGFAQAALHVLGLVRPRAWRDVRAVDLANACDPVIPGAEQLGDLAFYGADDAHGRPVVSHVMVALGGGIVIGATGGGRDTHGQDPRACVQAVALAYRRDLIVVGRLKDEYRR